MSTKTETRNGASEIDLAFNAWIRRVQAELKFLLIKKSRECARNSTKLLAEKSRARERERYREASAHLSKLCAQQHPLLWFSIVHLTLLACCGLSRLINILRRDASVRVQTSIYFWLRISKAHVCAMCVCVPIHPSLLRTRCTTVITFYPSNSIFLRRKRMRRAIFHSARNLSFRVQLFNRLPSSFSTFQWHLMESVFPLYLSLAHSFFCCRGKTHAFPISVKSDDWSRTELPGFSVSFRARCHFSIYWSW